MLALLLLSIMFNYFFIYMFRSFFFSSTKYSNIFVSKPVRAQPLWVCAKSTFFSANSIANPQFKWYFHMFLWGYTMPLGILALDAVAAPNKSFLTYSPFFSLGFEDFLIGLGVQPFALYLFVSLFLLGFIFFSFYFMSLLKSESSWWSYVRVAFYFFIFFFWCLLYALMVKYLHNAHCAIDIFIGSLYFNPSNNYYFQTFVVLKSTFLLNNSYETMLAGMSSSTLRTKGHFIEYVLNHMQPLGVKYEGNFVTNYCYYYFDFISFDSLMNLKMLESNADSFFPKNFTIILPSEIVVEGTKPSLSLFEQIRLGTWRLVIVNELDSVPNLAFVKGIDASGNVSWAVFGFGFTPTGDFYMFPVSLKLDSFTNALIICPSDSIWFVSYFDVDKDVFPFDTFYYVYFDKSFLSFTYLNDFL